MDDSDQTLATVVPARSECPIASALDLLGDKWTLLVLRDLLDGKSRFVDLERSPESIPSNLLSDRLKRLESAGLIERFVPEGRARHEYQVTSAGRNTRPIILALAAWGNTHIADTWVPPEDYLAEGPIVDGVG